MTVKRILELSRRCARQPAALEFSPIDHDMPFMPEQFTQLYHTPLYAELNRAQRLCYNQLCGASANEHFMLFETGFTNRVMAKLLAHPLVVRDTELRECLRLMLHEELRHSAMFRELNRHSMPQFYDRYPYRFTRPSLLERTLLWCVTQIPGQLFFLIWLVLIMEEHSNHIARHAISHSGSLGRLEPNYVQVHRTHLRDEMRHVHIDAELLRLFVGRAGYCRRAINARALNRLLLEILTPRRAGIAVLRELVRQHPELAPRHRQLRTAVSALGIDPGFSMTLTEAAQSPLTRQMLNSYPEFLLPIPTVEFKTNE